MPVAVITRPPNEIATESCDGIDDELLCNEEFMALVLPCLRAGATMFDSYRHRGDGRLPCPITASGGLSDNHVDPEGLAAWGDLTPEFSSRPFEGGHFFIQSNRQRVLAELARILDGHLAEASARVQQTER